MYRPGLLPVQAGRIRGADHHSQAEAGTNLIGVRTGHNPNRQHQRGPARNKYIEIKPQDPNAKKHWDWPEYQTCKSMTEAIVTKGTEKGEIRKICANPECPVHRPKKQRPAGDERIKAEHEKQRREEALANAVGLRVLSAIVAAVPVRLT
jgi:ParB family chromosome partitioning protein